VVGFGYRLTAITILDRAILVLDHWPVGPRLLMPLRLPFPESLGDLASGALSKRLLRQCPFALDGRVDLGRDHSKPRVDVRRSSNGHPVTPFWLHIRVAHHGEHILERQDPIRRGLVGNLKGLAVR